MQFILKCISIYNFEAGFQNMLCMHVSNSKKKKKPQQNTKISGGKNDIQKENHTPLCV